MKNQGTCRICGKIIRIDEVLHKSGPAINEHWHCVRKQNKEASCIKKA